MTTIYLPRYKSCLPPHGAELIETFVARMIPGGEVAWKGNIWKRAGVGVAYGYAPDAQERDHVWETARAVLALLPKRDLSKELIPMNCKATVISRSEAEAICEKKYGLSGVAAMVPTHAGAE